MPSSASRPPRTDAEAGPETRSEAGSEASPRSEPERITADGLIAEVFAQMVPHLAMAMPPRMQRAGTKAEPDGAGMAE